MSELKENSSYYDLVLMDWKMPGMNGIETAEKIKGDSDLDMIPIIILVTAYSHSQVVKEAKSATLDGVLQKPINPSVLIDAIMNTFELGRKDDVPNAADVDSSVDRKREPISAIAGAKVLVVEDNRINQQVSSELLTGFGMFSDIANNGLEAVEMALTGGYDMVFMDIQMPIMDGYEATAKIRENENCLSLPIVAMTAHAMKGDREKCLSVGMNDHISKPIDPERLLSLIHI